MFGKLDENLLMAGMKRSAREYLEECLKKSAAVSLSAFCLFLLLGFEIINAFAFLLLCFLLSALLLTRLPKEKALKKGKLIEKELPFAMMALGIELNIGIPFEKALLKRAGKTELGIEIAKAIAEIRMNGLSVQEAFLNMQKRIDSAFVKRAIAQLINIYENGSREQGEIAISIAKEMLARQKAEAKEFSGKLVMTSLLFIVVSAIVPALLLSYITVGSMFLEIEIQPLFVILIFTVILPLVDIAMLLILREKTPVFMRS